MTYGIYTTLQSLNGSDVRITTRDNLDSIIVVSAIGINSPFIGIAVILSTSQYNFSANCNFVATRLQKVIIDHIP